MIVTIDGPAGAGKSSVAKELARRLNFHFLDTGAMYRAVAYAVRRAGVNPDHEDAVTALFERIKLEFAPGLVKLDGEDLSIVIRTTEVANLSSRLAALDHVREYLVARQQAIGRKFDLVTEGRDQGTVVFPDAEWKFFMVADKMERARRRHRDLLNRGEQISFEQVLAAQDERDNRDTQRHTGPLRKAEDAIEIDTTNKTLSEVISEMEAIVLRCWAKPPTG